MPSILPGFEYDIFISYRHNDNLDGWVTDFVQQLEKELRATLKEPVTIYFDSNPHDGLHDHHEVDDSLAQKLKALILIPIVSRTYCDTNSFAWNNEFKVFVTQAQNDSIGSKVKVTGGNVANRVLPIRIHELNAEDVNLFESEMAGKMRAIDFIYKEPGVNRPLQLTDNRSDNQAKTDFRNQINKIANAIEDVIRGIKASQENNLSTESYSASVPKTTFKKELKRRSVIRASLVYVLFALVLWKVLNISTELLNLTENSIRIISLGLIVLFPISMLMAWLYERSPQGFIRTGSVESLNNPFSGEQKKPLTSNTFIGLLAITIVALFLVFPQLENDSLASNNPEVEKSIAVLPFTNLSNDPDQQFFADGVMEDILTQLQRMGELKVTSKTSVEQYRNNTKRVTDIGDELGVSYLLEGSVRKSDDQIMITAQLIRTGDDSHMWANNFTSEYTTKGLFDIQRQIAENIVQELSLKISPIKMKEITQAQTTNKEAYEAFQRGRQLYDQYNRTSNELAIEQLKLAIRKDPKYAAAYGGLSNAYLQRVIHYDYPENWRDSAVSIATRGLQLDSLCAECYKALGLSVGPINVKKTLYYYEKALSINPHYRAALSNSVRFYFEDGNIKAALNIVDRIRASDPKEFLYALGRTNRLLGNHEAAMPYLEKQLEHENPVATATDLLIVYSQLQKIDKFHVFATRIYELSDDSTYVHLAEMERLWVNKQFADFITYGEHHPAPYWNTPRLAYLYAIEGKTEQAAKICDKQIAGILEQFNDNPELVDSNLIMSILSSWYALKGDKNNCLKWMEKAILKGYLQNNYEHEFFDSVREEPRFKELVKIQEKKRKEALALMATYNFPKAEDL